MAAAPQPEGVLNPVPISFVPPDTEGETQNSLKKVQKTKRSKVNTESPYVSTMSKKGKKLKTDKCAPSDSSDLKRPDCLPEGWNIIERVRERGKTAGLKDKYYIEPGTGKKFRSQVEVRRHLGLLDDPPKTNETNNSPKEKSTKSDTQQYPPGYLGNLDFKEMVDEDSTEHEAIRDEDIKSNMIYTNADKSCQKDDASCSSSTTMDYNYSL